MIQLQLSQGSLNVLNDCPRKFQYLFLDQLGQFIQEEDRSSLLWGSQFHLVMQQRELGLLASHSPSLQTMEYQRIQCCVNALVDHVPALFEATPASDRFTEHRRSLTFQGVVLIAVYDLLITTPQRAEIIDWKTYPKPRQAEWLERNWQTCLYPFILSETSDYSPEDISLTYWFIQPHLDQPQPQSLQFSYSSDRHQYVYKLLTQQLNQLAIWLDEYETGKALPQVSEASPLCSRCAFAVRCDRVPRQSDPSVDSYNNLLDIEIVQEVSL